MDSSISQPNPLNNHHQKATTAAAAAITTTTNNNNDDYQVALTNMIGRDLNFMKETMTEIQKFVDHMNVQINQACEKFEELKTREGGSDTTELDQLKMFVNNLKSQIPSKIKIHYDDDSKPHRKPWFDGSINSSSGSNQVDIFPEMATIKKRFMIYLWIGEGLLPPIKSMDQNTEDEIMLGKTAKDFVNEILDELTAKGFIEPIHKNCELVVDSYRMPRYTRLAVSYELEARGFDYFRDLCFTCWEICIVNIDAAIIDGRHEIIFIRGTNSKVVSLERWQNSVTHHIDVSDIKFLNALKNMKQLRFLSLRGISLIIELP
ncbi:hypothetical protein LOK49_LG11G01404 [Camellia lanceoleosa]|uniref:Uncharacterized protein n=1 Tax=Camellia lanceoleosa TaxID=1840588 RepID=A0ACC0FXJ2_9ERIC|nr:hypothetical protein LOK49_LG11G01404 [Camellia lanceoleosa]